MSWIRCRRTASEIYLTGWRGSFLKVAQMFLHSRLASCSANNLHACFRPGRWASRLSRKRLFGRVARASCLHGLSWTCWQASLCTQNTISLCWKNFGWSRYWLPSRDVTRAAPAYPPASTKPCAPFWEGLSSCLRVQCREVRRHLETAWIWPRCSLSARPRSRFLWRHQVYGRLLLGPSRPRSGERCRTWWPSGVHAPSGELEN